MTRKIDKRACRKFAMPELEFNLNEGVLHVESCPYIIRTAVRNIAGQRILVLYIYQRESILAGSIKPRWVMFHSRDDFATLSFRENAKATWQCSTLDSLDRIGGFDSKCAFYRQQDEARVARFCKCERGAISMLGYLQRLISYRKELERKWKKQRAIIGRMKYVPVLPRDLKGFIHREVMPQYIFYDYQRKAPGHAYCTACRHEVRIAAAKHNTSGLCPRCKKKITFKCRGRRGRIFDRETVQVLQKAKNGEMLLRIVKAYRTFTDADTPVYFSVYENETVGMDIACFESILKMTQGELKEYLVHQLREQGYEPVCKNGFLYAEGTIPVLLVAHLDTVHTHRPDIICRSEDGRYLMSPDGIGGDDRAGVYMILLLMRECHCHILFCEDEEIGGIGAKKFAKSKLYPEVNYMQYRYRKLLERCGVRYRNFHAMRHTYATRCMENGVDIKSLSELLGHADIRTTLQTYIHSSLAHKKQAVQSICFLPIESTGGGLIPSKIPSEKLKMLCCQGKQARVS